MIVYSKKPLSIKYNDKEINDILNQYVDNHKTGIFSYHQFCNYLFDYVNEHNKLGKGDKTTYLSAEMMRLYFKGDYSGFVKKRERMILDAEKDNLKKMFTNLYVG